MRVFRDQRVPRFSSYHHVWLDDKHTFLQVIRRYRYPVCDLRTPSGLQLVDIRLSVLTLFLIRAFPFQLAVMALESKTPILETLSRIFVVWQSSALTDSKATVQLVR